MSESILNQAADRKGPMQRTTPAGQFPPLKCVIGATGASQNIDLSGAGFFTNLKYTDHYVSISVEGAASLWWYWSDVGTDTIDKTATGNGATVGAFLPSGIVQDEKPTGQFLVLQTSAAANVHIWISSGKY